MSTTDLEKKTSHKIISTQEMWNEPQLGKWRNLSSVAWCNSWGKG